MSDFIPPFEAFRLILRAIYPADPDLAMHFTSPADFQRAANDYKFRPMTPTCRPETNEGPLSYYGDEPPPDHAWKPSEALRLLRVGIWQRKIALQGERPGEARKEIDGIDRAQGELEVFADTLTVEKAAVKGLPVTDTFRRVWCARADVEAWIAELVPNTAPSSQEVEPCKPRRQTTKGEALDEAAAALYPKGVPAVSDLENKRLADAVQCWLKTYKPAIKVNDRTILRKFGRAS